MVSEDRQRVIETNRSLRLIKNVSHDPSLSHPLGLPNTDANPPSQELESLLEKGIIDDSAFDTIHSLLPAESSLSGPAAASRNTTPAPAHHTNNALNQPPNQPPPTHHTPNPPPTYAQSTVSPPSLPSRTPAPAPPAPEKPVLAHARALYKYTATDARDLSFDRDDRVAVHEYMNADWWMGRNERTGAEGIFPRSYVVIDNDNISEKVGYQQPQYAQPVPVQQYGAVGGYPAAPPAGQAVQPYGQQQGEQEGGSKVGEAGKKIGKKLGNAAIFGAGATIGSNIVNSIF